MGLHILPQGQVIPEVFDLEIQMGSVKSLISGRVAWLSFDGAAAGVRIITQDETWNKYIKKLKMFMEQKLAA